MGEEFVTRIKQVAADPAAGPMLNDLLDAEAGRLIAALGGDEFGLGVTLSDDGVIDRLDRYAALTGDLARAVALGARWSGDLVRPIWPALIERVVGAVDRAGGQATWVDLSQYPGALLLHAAGVGALAGNRYDNLRAILLEPHVLYRNERRMAIEVLNSQAVMDPNQAARVDGLSNTFAPLSERLAADLRPVLADVVADETVFGRLFDRFEYLLGLVYLDVTKTAWAPTGRFSADQYGTGIDQVVEAEIKAAGTSWGPLAAGLFGGSSDRLEDALGRSRTVIEAARREARFRRLR
ncbi:MAG TPA: hypothetical protein VFP56_11600 [Candidatus Limnocylindrales bacterium]|nr:hypothetical protein [Candidatus Limnocylindrales bacterium]